MHQLHVNARPRMPKTSNVNGTQLYLKYEKKALLFVVTLDYLFPLFIVRPCQQLVTAIIKQHETGNTDAAVGLVIAGKSSPAIR